MVGRFLFILVMFVVDKSFGQTDSVNHFFAFRLNDYNIKLNDSATIVQISLPESWPISIKKNQSALVKRRYEGGLSYDTSVIGIGRCDLIEAGYYYFTIHHDKEKAPLPGDLLYAKINLPFSYNGLLFRINTHDIIFTTVNKKLFYDPIAIFTMTKQKEIRILDSMVADIKFTGKAMLRQMPKENEVIKGGIYKGKKLFIAMQEVKRNEVEEFLKYIFARPFRYAGNVWKISEAFATWIVNGTPKVLKD